MKILLGTILILQLFILGILLFSHKNTPVNSENFRAMAVKLEFEKLYSQAISLYEKYASLETNPIKLGAAYLKIADLYFEHVHRYDEALSYYYMALHYISRQDLRSEIERKTVNCLDNLGRGKDARKKLEQSALIDPEKHKNSTAVAKIGSRIVTMSELEEEINSLPESIQANYRLPEQKLDFLRQYIQEELLYEKGIRQNYDRSNDVLQTLEKAKRSIIAQKVIAENIGNVAISPQEIQDYYNKNPEKFTSDNTIIPFDQCKQKAAELFHREKIGTKAEEFMTQLFRESNVIIHENLFRSTK